MIAAASAMPWLDPQFKLEHVPFSLQELDRIVDRVSLGAMVDVPVVESYTSVVTTDTLVDIVKGCSLTNQAIDFIGDLIEASGGALLCHGLSGGNGVILLGCVARAGRQSPLA